MIHEVGYRQVRPHLDESLNFRGRPAESSPIQQMGRRVEIPFLRRQRLQHTNCLDAAALQKVTNCLAYAPQDNDLAGSELPLQSPVRAGRFSRHSAFVTFLTGTMRGSYD